MKLRSDNTRHHQPLPWLVLASLALHAGLLAWQTPQLHEVPVLGSRSDALAIRLSTPHTPAQQPAPSRMHESADALPAATAAADRDNHRTRPEPLSSSPPPPATDPVAEAGTATATLERQASIEQPERVRATHQAAPEPQLRPRAAASPAPGRPVETPAEAQRSAVLEEIRDALQRHFFYPRLARLRNWEGNVLLGFQVHSDGRIEDIQVLESSGRAVLDQAALNALRSVRQVAWNATRPIDLQLPVAYRLH